MGITLGLSSGLFHALMGLVSKKTLKKTDEYVLAFSYALFSLPFILFGLFWLDLSPTDFTFWYATVASSLLSCLAIVLMMYALRIGELSYSMPLLSFTPAFLILTAAAMLGEMPTRLGVLGVTLITFGAYVMSCDPRHYTNFFTPVKSLLSSRGARAMFAVAFIYAISSNFNKMAVESANPITYLIFVQALSVLILLPFIVLFSKRGERIKGIKINLKPLLLVGFLVAASLLAQMTALTFTLVSYVIALKRTGSVFSVILGLVALKEKNIPVKLTGSVLMLIGVLLIYLA